MFVSRPRLRENLSDMLFKGGNGLRIVDQLILRGTTLALKTMFEVWQTYEGQVRANARFEPILAIARHVWRWACVGS